MTLRKLPLLAVALAALLLLAAACGDDDDAGDDDNGGGADPPASSGVGPGISVAEALDSSLDEPLLVNGFLVVQGGEARLCELLAESAPPQCGGDSLLVEGLDVDAIDGLTSEQGTTWSDQQIQLLGEVEGETLTISGQVSA